MIVHTIVGAETIAWESVDHMLAWANLEVHEEATASMVEAAANITSTIQDVVRSWEQWRA